MKIKRSANWLTAVIIGLAGLFPLALNDSAFAAANNCIWTGASSYDMATAGNWSSCGGVAPQTDDNLVFTYGSGVAQKSVNNNYATGFEFGSIRFTGARGASETAYSLIGNAFKLTGGITSEDNSDAQAKRDTISVGVTFSNTQTIDVQGSNRVDLGGTLTGSGASGLTKNGTGTLFIGGVNPALFGSVTSNGGLIIASGIQSLGSNVGATTINSGSALRLTDGSGAASCSTALSFAESLTLNGSSTAGDVPKFEIRFANCLPTASNSADVTYGTINTQGGTVIYLTGAITLGANIVFMSNAQTTNIGGNLAGAYSITIPSNGYGGVINIGSETNGSQTPNGAYRPATITQTLSDNQAGTSINVLGNTIITLDGRRGDATVQYDGKLKGTGTMAALNVGSGGTVAPGHSPGCMVVSSGLTLLGTYEVEIGGTAACTDYDQLQVNGTVNVAGGTLDTSLINGFELEPGQNFTLITNDGNDAVIGEFAGFAEGVVYSNGSVDFSINYHGGDGNDVVLSINAPDPDPVPVDNGGGTANPTNPGQTTPTSLADAIAGIPNTGIRLMMAHPMISMLVTTTAAGLIIFIARRRGLLGSGIRN